MLVSYLCALLWPQALPIGATVSFVVIFIAAFLQRWSSSTGGAIGGTLLLILGLTAFLEGLRLFFITLSEGIGKRLPSKHRLPAVLIVAGALGILVTYAEPAISSLTPLGARLTGRSAPQLVTMLGRLREVTVLVIALAVGTAAVLGMLRYVHQWRLTNVLPVVMLPAMGISCWLMWGTNDRATVAMAWDCGAATTGPITVPILMAIGLSAARQYRSNDGASSKTNVTGFGNVALATFLPVTFVGLFAALLSYAGFSSYAVSRPSIIDLPPLQPFVASARAVVPLALFLLGVWHFLIRAELPAVQYRISLPSDSGGGSDAPPPTNLPLAWAGAFLVALFGAIALNYGITYGLVILGDSSGALLPALYTHIATYTPSPRYASSVGYFLAGLFGGGVGFLATIAEPALQIMAEQALEATERRIGGKRLTVLVSVGVALGTMTGLYRVIFVIPVIYFLIPGYVIAYLLSLAVSEEVCAVAWDCAGVSTGPLIVPFLLSLGMNLAKASASADGFGIIACAALGPVLAVLCDAVVMQWMHRDGTSV